MPRSFLLPKYSRRSFFGIIAALTGCAYLPPTYPNFTDRKAVIAQAQAISDKLEQYIKDWMDGKVPAEIPNSLLPDGRDPNIVNYKLQKPEEIDPAQQWGVREATPIDLNNTQTGFPDPHATYALLPNLFAPFGSKAYVEGEFPHSRFFDLQVSPAFQPEIYRYGGAGGALGVGEVPIVDADIDPLPGHTNPFRLGADRNATNRSYQVIFDLKAENPTDDPAYHPPYYRAPGNTRLGSGIEYQGPWGDADYKPIGSGNGLWDTGSIWLRYYAPDKAAGPMGGVLLPKVTCALADGRRFFIAADFSKWADHINIHQPAATTPPVDPPTSLGADVGWTKQWGVYRAIMRSVLAGYISDDATLSSYTRDFDKGVASHGPDVAPPGNYERSATDCSYIDYLLRGMSLGENKVLIITGKLPTTPATRNSESTMTGAQARYWSLTSYEVPATYKDGDSIGSVMTSIMDDEISTDSQGRYVIVYSRDTERPNNATAENGVTWLNWGPSSKQAFTLRWMNVDQGWNFEKSPDESHLGWNTDPSSVNYDPTLLGKNDQRGFLGEYQPIFHYLTRTDFEAISGPITFDKVPTWE